MKSSSELPLLLEIELQLAIEPEVENRLPKVGVISGVGRPAALTVTPIEERL